MIKNDEKSIVKGLRYVLKQGIWCGKQITKGCAELVEIICDNYSFINAEQLYGEELYARVARDPTI